ncbi:MAG: hypothetical protein PF689_05710 [Deltaproteobacteria bacterium]|nr:hypothetical protein [Deltaproteobacteria bacterium]
MANILVYIETENNTISPSSLKALTIGRTISSKMGATLYAVIPLQHISDSNRNFLQQIAAYNADKIVTLISSFLKGPPRLSTVGKMVHETAIKFPPAIFLLGNTPFSYELGPWLSGKINGIYSKSTIFDKNQVAKLSSAHLDSGTKHSYDIKEIEQPLVLTVEGFTDYIPESINDIENIAVEAKDKDLSTNFFVNKLDYIYSENYIIIAGSKTGKKIDQLKKLAHAQEWSLCCTKQYLLHQPKQANNHPALPKFSSIDDSREKTNYILYGFTATEFSTVNKFFSPESNCLLIDSEFSKQEQFFNTAYFNGDSAKLLESLTQRVL